MEDRLWVIVLSLLSSEQSASPRDTYDARTILMVGLWAILHDRPFCWACCPENWRPRWRPQHLPHASTLCRRWRRDDLQAAAQQVHQRVLQRLPASIPYAFIDGKPLIISDLSKDPDARNGRGTRGMARGYKLHAVIDAGGVVRAFDVQSLNVNERKPAAKLLLQLPSAVRRVVADGNYDSAPLHRVLETTHVRLYTPILNNYAGPRTHPRRRILQRLMQTLVGQKLLHWRDDIERHFARMGNIGCGLKGLPNWVRRHRRVFRWIWGKILIYHAWLIDQANRP